MSVLHLILNILFFRSEKETRKINLGYMNHIIMQAMALIIQEVILIEQYSIEDEENLLLVQFFQLFHIG